MANLKIIKTIAEQKKIPINKLAQMVGVREQAIHVMCNTNSTKIETLEKIAKALGVPTTTFFEEESKIEIRNAERDYYENNDIQNINNSCIDQADEIASLKAQISELQQELIVAQSKIIALLAAGK